MSSPSLPRISTPK